MQSNAHELVKHTKHAVITHADGTVTVIGDIHKDWDQKPLRRLIFRLQQWMRRMKANGNSK